MRIGWWGSRGDETRTLRGASGRGRAGAGPSAPLPTAAEPRGWCRAAWLLFRCGARQGGRGGGGRLQRGDGRRRRAAAAAAAGGRRATRAAAEQRVATRRAARTWRPRRTPPPYTPAGTFSSSVLAPTRPAGRGALTVVAAGGNSMGNTLRGTKRCRRRVSGFRTRMASANGRHVLAARRKKGRKNLCPASTRLSGGKK